MGKSKNQNNLQLYELQGERDWQLEQKKREKEMEQAQEDQKYTFKPKILSKSVERRPNSSIGRDYFNNMHFSPGNNGN